MNLKYCNYNGAELREMSVKLYNDYDGFNGEQHIFPGGLS